MREELSRYFEGVLREIQTKTNNEATIQKISGIVQSFMDKIER